MKIATVYGPFAQGLNGAFDMGKVFTQRGVTGSEGSWCNAGRGLAELGHDVTMFADVTAETDYHGARVRKRTDAPLRGYDAVLAWNEPDLLRGADGLRICAQQLNDFNYCQPGWQEHVDLFVSPSEAHRARAVALGYFTAERSTVVPNSVNLEMFRGAPCLRCGGTGHGLKRSDETGSCLECVGTGEIRQARDPHRVAYCSSPDRGLHHLLSFWPEVRRRVPDARLDVYYHVRRFLDATRGQDNEFGRRGRYLAEALRRLGTAGENGVTLHDQRPNVEVYRALAGASVLAYPCDPIAWCEGFGVAVLDACAAGCLPIISDADALPEVFDDAARIIRGNPAERRQEWVDAIAGSLKTVVRERTEDYCREFAIRYSRQNVAGQWSGVLASHITARSAA